MEGRDYPDDMLYRAMPRLDQAMQECLVREQENTPLFRTSGRFERNMRRLLQKAGQRDVRNREGTRLNGAGRALPGRTRTAGRTGLSGRRLQAAVSGLSGQYRADGGRDPAEQLSAGRIWGFSDTPSGGRPDRGSEIFLDGEACGGNHGIRLCGSAHAGGSHDPGKFGQAGENTERWRITVSFPEHRALGYW